MAQFKGLAHVGLFITDIERSKKFYTDILEFKVFFEYENEEPDGTVTKVAFLDNGNLRIELVQLGNPEQRGDGWVDHFAMAVEDIEGMQKKLIERGVVFESDEIVYRKAALPNGAKWLMFRGPDGEHLEIAEAL